MTAVVQIGGTLADTKQLRRKLNLSLDHNYKGQQWYRGDDFLFTLLPDDSARAAACICRLVYSLDCTEILFTQMSCDGKNVCASRLLAGDSQAYYPDMQFHSVEYSDFQADSMVLKTIDYLFNSNQWTYTSGDSEFIVDMAVRLRENQEFR